MSGANPYEPPKQVNEPKVVKEARWAGGWRVVVIVSAVTVLFAVAFAIFVYLVFPPGVWHWSIRRGGWVVYSQPGGWWVDRGRVIAPHAKRMQEWETRAEQMAFFLKLQGWHVSYTRFGVSINDVPPSRESDSLPKSKR